MKPIKLKLFGFNVLEFGSLPDGNPPQKQVKFLSPRYEPSNISSDANVMRITEALRLAEAGDTQELFRFYRDVLLSDDHIAGEFSTRKLAVLSQPLAILPEDKNNPDDVILAKAMLRAKNDCENWNDGMKALMGSHAIWPVTVTERLYKPAGAPRPGEPKLNFTLRKFVPVNPQLLCFQWAYMMGGVGLGTASAVQLGNLNTHGARRRPADSYTIDLERWEPYIKLWPIDEAGRIIYDVTHACYLDPARHVVHRGHDLVEFRDNWGGPGRSLLHWWLFRQLGRDWFAKGMENYGTPWPVGHVDSKDPEAIRLLREAFQLSKSIGGIVVDENSRVELKEAMVAGMANGHEIFHNICNSAISFRITGLKESKKPAGLNAGEGKFQQNVREDVRVHDQMTLGETCKKQIAWPFRDLNNLKGDVKFIWGGLSDADAKTFADLLYTMRQAGYQLAEESIPTANERTGLSWERSPVPTRAEGALPASTI
ncbi:MAG TPA: DUF935 family protein [Candidatus Acidoferrales bacterium]|jgi:hypothetical protein|nr:DUF935 family protein [Candidatus Acidoferrales bacterium]